MELENMLLMMLHMKETGLMEKKREKVKLFSRVEAFLRDILRMI